jgi:transaldolase
MEVSPLLAYDTAGSIEQAKQLHKQAQRPNMFVKIPGTPAGLGAIEEAVFAGVPINVTLLFSCEQYLAAAQAYMRAIERRIAGGLDPNVTSVASLFVSRWDVAIKDKVPAELRNRLGIAIAKLTYKAYHELLSSTRWAKLSSAGARPQQLLWASTGTKDPDAPDTLYIDALAAPDTVNTMPDKTLQAFADHGQVNAVMPADGGDAQQDTSQLLDQQIWLHRQNLLVRLNRLSRFKQHIRPVPAVLRMRSGQNPRRSNRGCAEDARLPSGSGETDLVFRCE